MDLLRLGLWARIELSQQKNVNMPPRISVITPCRNSASFLEDAIVSVREQSYPDFEHLIVDGVSTDGTVELLKRQDGIRWISEPDQGQSDAINKGFRMATGDIISWLNSDDRYLPGVFERVVRIFESDPSLDAVYSNFYFTDRSFNRIRPIYSNRPIAWLSVVYGFIPSTTIFFRRRILDEGNFIDPSFRLCMDKEFFARLLALGYRFRYENDFFAEFRLHGANISLPNGRRNPDATDEALRIIHSHLGFQLPFRPVEVLLYGLAHLLIKPLRLGIRGRE